MRLPPHLALLACMLPAALLGGAPADARELKLATWNLEWLTLRPDGDPSLPDDAHPKQPADIAILATYASRLDADAVGIEEVDGPEIAARVFPPDRYRIEMTHDSVVQRVGLAVRNEYAVTRNPDVTGLDAAAAGALHRLRSGLDVTIARDGRSLRILVVHLKTGCWDRPLQGRGPDACRTLRKQLVVLQDWIERRRDEGVAFVLMGDFNRDMLAHDAFLDALRQAAPLALATAGRANPCWGGESFIDHILAGGPALHWLEPDSLRVTVYRETDPDMKERLSDHCPVSVRLDTAR
jgi:endonuclease/exonuclease/phosphatase family metal-dependent hydrolase